MQKGLATNQKEKIMGRQESLKTFYSLTCKNGNDARRKY
jgi:hypothetical protein